MKSTLRLTTVVLALVLGQLGPVAAQTNDLTPLAASAAKVDDKIVRQLEVRETARFVVEFEARPDLSNASSIDDFTARGQAVINALQATARRSQRAALRLVDRLDGSADAFWFRNVMIVEGDAALVDALAALPGVKEIRPERIYPLIRPVERAAPAQDSEPEWGVARIGADQVWEQGITGGGIVVANLDSGVDFTHPAIVNQYRGNLGGGTFDHNYNFFDPTGICGEAPCDNTGHGTHVMGTMVGGDGLGPFTPDIGVAPGARWIAAKGCEDFGCSEFALLAAGQFILAPTDVNGENPDPSMRPDIVNNSWGGGPGDPFYLETVENWRAAGIIPVFASGNPGPFCGEGGSPGDYLESFSAGATDIEDVIADFSGRGPSVFGKINPDVSAPGVDVVSSVPGGGYESFSGTSMAAPHVSGALALMMSASPELIGDFAGATGTLASTAVDIIDLSCGGDEDGDPNNVYGEGRIDALAAVNLVATGGSLVGTVTAAAGGAPIAGAAISASNGERNFNTFTAADGTFNLFLAADEYVVTASAFGFETAVASGVVINTDETTVQDFALEELPSFRLRGRVLRAESGQPLAGATVRVFGVPVPPVTTDNLGRYSFRLPAGTYDVEASQGGCASREIATVELNRNRFQVFRLVQVIDDFGHACFPIPFDWVDATSPTTVYGDDQTGRLPLPFPVSYFGNTYNDLFITTNGYLAFEDVFGGFSEYFNSPIPSTQFPNAAIYALWQDLWVVGEPFISEDSRVEYDVFDAGSLGQGLVVEYSNVPRLGQAAGANFEVKIYETGTIDLVYGAGMDNVGNGGEATVGIESPDGTDGIQLSFREPVLTSNTAWRFAQVPTGNVAGVITNANDGLPVAGATVTAFPGGRSATTDGDGRYDLRLVPGRYQVVFEAPNYVVETASVRVRPGRVSRVNRALAAARAEVTPPEIVVETPIGEAATAVVTVANTGSAPLAWQVRERDLGGTPPVLPPAPAMRVVRPATWAPFAAPEGFGPSYVGEPTFNGDLLPIIEDPLGDAIGPVDIGTVSGGAGEFEASMQIEFSPDTPMGETVGFVFLDTDQDPNTGLPPEAFNGLPTQDIGMEYFVDLFGAPFEGIGFVVDANTFELVAEIPVITDGQSYRFDIPLEALGGDDGAIDVAMVLGNFEQPTDWAPDVGHGTIEPFRDAPWMSAAPESGVIEPGDSTEVTVTLGGPGVDPGEYAGQLIFLANDPRQGSHPVEVALSIPLPEGEGSVRGVVTNARDGSPVPAEILVSAERDGAPVEIPTAADENGEYLLFGPAGTWPITASLEGFQTFEGEVTIQGGFEVTFDIEIQPLWPNASVEGGPLAFELGVGETADAELTLGNLGGLADLEFEVKELAGQPAAAVVPGVHNRPARDPSRPSNASLASIGGTTAAPAVLQEGTVLVFQDFLPWESAALQEVLENNGIEFDLVGSEEMESIDMTPYEVVFVSNDQPQEFYEAFTASVGRFEEYVNGGGFLWMGAAGWGWNGGEPDGLPLPGGVFLNGPEFEDENVVVQPEHPVVAGLPEVFFGSFASHSFFIDAPDGSTITVGAFTDEPTLIEYELGAGRVLATTQPLEFHWENGQDGAVILENSVPYAVAFEPFTDLEWLSVTPDTGIVPPDGVQPLTVQVDATGLEPGTYEAFVVVLTNDPLNRSIKVPVTLNVAA